MSATATKTLIDGVVPITPAKPTQGLKSSKTLSGDLLKVCSSFFERTLSCKSFEQANQIDEKYRWYNSVRAFTIQIMSRKVGRDYEMNMFEDYFLQIWDWIMDRYSKGGVMTKSSGDSLEAGRKDRFCHEFVREAIYCKSAPPGAFEGSCVECTMGTAAGKVTDTTQKIYCFATFKELSGPCHTIKPLHKDGVDNYDQNQRMYMFHRRAYETELVVGPLRKAYEKTVSILELYHLNDAGSIYIPNNLEVKGTETVTGDVTHLNNTQVNGDLTCAKTTTTQHVVVDDMATVKGNVSLEGSTNTLKKALIVQGQSNLHALTVEDGGIEVKGATKLHSATEIMSTLRVRGQSSLHNVIVRDDKDANDPMPLAAGECRVWGNTLLQKQLDVVDGPTTLQCKAGNFFVKGTTELTGQLTCLDNHSIRKNLDVTGTSELTGATHVTGTLLVDGQTTTNGLQVRKELQVIQDTKLNADCIVDKELKIEGDTTLKSNCTVLNNLEVRSGSTTLQDLKVTKTLEVQQQTNMRGLVLQDNKGMPKEIVQDGQLKVQGDVHFLSKLDVKDATTLQSTLDVTGDTNVQTLTTAKDTTVNGKFRVEKDETQLLKLTVQKGGLTAEGPTVTNETTVRTTLDVREGTSLNNTTVRTTLDVKGTTNTEEINCHAALTVKGETNTEDTIVNRTLTVKGQSDLNCLHVGPGPHDKHILKGGELRVEKDTELQGDLTVRQSALINQNLTVDKPTLLKDTLSVDKNTELRSVLDVVGVTNLKDNTNVVKVLDVKGDTNLNNTTVRESLTVNGATTVQPLYVKDKLTVTEATTLLGATQIKNTLNVDNLATIESCKVDNGLDVHGQTNTHMGLVNTDKASGPPPTAGAGNFINTGNTTVKQNFTVNGESVHNNTLTVTNGLTNVQTLTAEEDTIINGKLVGNKDVNFNQKLTVEKELITVGPTRVSDLDVSKCLTVHEKTDLQDLKATKTNLGQTFCQATTVENALTVKGPTETNTILNGGELRVKGISKLNSLAVFPQVKQDPPDLPKDGQLHVHEATKLLNVLDVMQDTTLNGSKLTVTKGVTDLQDTNVHVNLVVTDTLTVEKGKTSLQETLVNTGLTVDGETQTMKAIVRKDLNVVQDCNVDCNLNVKKNLDVDGKSDMGDTVCFHNGYM